MNTSTARESGDRVALFCTNSYSHFYIEHPYPANTQVWVWVGSTHLLPNHINLGLGNTQYVHNYPFENQMGAKPWLAWSFVGHTHDGKVNLPSSEVRRISDV